LNNVELVHIGFGSVIALNRVLVIATPDSAPIKRLVQEAREQNALIDVTCGRKTKAVIVLDNGHLVLAAIQPETIATRHEQVREVDHAGARE
jgi:regulator of extracellular matrix RemA (YlzA/DUF370 family)